jgi:hypothetical protein
VKISKARFAFEQQCWRLALFSIVLFSVSCCEPAEKPVRELFSALSPDSTGISFSNKLAFSQEFNIYTYRNFYNGGGVGIGDVNNDGLIDVYLVANQAPNKLFINKGNFKFEDITRTAGVGGSKSWSTGVSMADVNGDGWLDIYICNSGDVKGDNKENELFINNGDLTFTERAKEYGLADKGFTTHAIFFDYDRDNDLDVYILNNSYRAIGSFNLQKNERPKRDLLGGDKLMRNENGHFIDISEQAGIYGSVIGFGLGASVGDINKDGWLDIYVSNDFFERDYLYINKQDGSFRECLTEQMKSVSGASMGADLADVNNDAYPDIFVTEMLPESNQRLKTVTTFENWDRYQNNLNNDFYHQFTRNMLQLNNGNNSFSEIGRLTGMEATEWSWGALIFDMDNDGLKDVFVANGIYQDLTNQDYLQYVSGGEVVKSIVSNNQVDYKKLVELIPSTPVSDFAFRNLGSLRFENMTVAWGLDELNFSNGSAYADLDNDGDMDLVINRVNEQASILRNESNILNRNNRYLKFELHGLGSNSSAIGTKITAKIGEMTYYLEHLPNRGFESSVDPRPNLGVGQVDHVDEVLVEWPSGVKTTLTNVATNQTLKLQEPEGVALAKRSNDGTIKKIFSKGFVIPAIEKHVENDFVDFDRDRLIYHMLSTEGPKVSVADVNGDGLSDFFIGGAKDQTSAIYLQQRSGSFVKKIDHFLNERTSEDTGSIFFDADADGDQDLYVCSGGNEFSPSSSAFLDRLYFNDGKGGWIKSEQSLPSGKFESTSCVVASDVDSDGDQDLFVGVRLAPFSYGMPVNGYLLKNDGKGFFATAQIIENIGMITSAIWADVDSDRDDDLVIVGEWMPVSVYINNHGKLERSKPLINSNGWWNTIASADLDNDGDLDFVIGNHGWNSRFRASIDKPVTMWVSDFDQNGMMEQIITTFIGNKSYPMVLRHDLLSQIPSLKKKFLKYEDYKNATISEIFSPEQLKAAQRLDAFNFSTSIMFNQGNGNFTLEALPIEAQISPVYAVHVEDIDKDGNKDILMGGNLYRVKPEAGRYDASYGTFLKGDGKGKFKVVPNKDCGLMIDGEVRDIKRIKVGKNNLILVARNNDTPIFLKVNE